MQEYKWIVISHNRGERGLNVFYSNTKTSKPPSQKHMRELFSSEMMDTLRVESIKGVRRDIKRMIEGLIDIMVPDENEYKVIEETSEGLCDICNEIENMDYLELEVSETIEKIQETLTKSKGVCRNCFEKQWGEFQETALNDKKDLSNEIEKIDSLDGGDFEKYIATLLKELGLDYAKVNNENPDWGVDVIASWNEKKIGIQCKRHRKLSMSIDAVREAICGSAYYDCNYSVVIATCEMSPNANKLANKLGVNIIDREKLITIIKGVFEKQNKEELIKMVTGELEFKALVK